MIEKINLYILIGDIQFHKQGVKDIHSLIMCVDIHSLIMCVPS